jgi:hypothetical protein
MSLIAMQPGLIEIPINALTTTADTKSASYAIPQGKTPARTITWQSIPTGGPSAISLQLQAAMRDNDSEFAVIDTSSATAGETKVVSNINFPFIRVRQVSRTGGTDITVLVHVSG